MITIKINDFFVYTRQNEKGVENVEFRIQLFVKKDEIVKVTGSGIKRYTITSYIY